jgi:hypothetical protein
MRRTIIALIVLLAIPLAIADGLFYPTNGGTVTGQGGVVFAGSAYLGDGQELVLGLPSINLSYGPNVNVVRFLGCGPKINNPDSKPQGQTNNVGIDKICNNGMGSGDVIISLNRLPAANWTLYASGTGPTKDLTLNTTPKVVISGLDPGSCQYVWLTANCSYVRTSPNATQVYDVTAST